VIYPIGHKEQNVFKYPEIFMSHPKATRFFIKDKNYDRGLNWYLQTYFVGAEQYPIRGEATPSYLAQAEITAPRIKDTISENEVKFIAIFRNPVERAYSHYWYNRNKKAAYGEDLSFKDALNLENKHDNGLDLRVQRYSRSRNYFKNGEYSRYLMEYFKYFRREQFLLLLTEDIHKEYFQSTSTQIATFLGIEDISINYIRENRSRKVGARPSVKFVRKQRRLMNFLKASLPMFMQNKLRDRYTKIISTPVRNPPMKLNTRKILLERYKPGIMELQEIIGRDLSSWMSED